MAPFLVNRPVPYSQLIMAREVALATARNVKATPGTTVSFFYSDEQSGPCQPVGG